MTNASLLSFKTHLAELSGSLLPEIGHCRPCIFPLTYPNKIKLVVKAGP